MVMGKRLRRRLMRRGATRLAWATVTGVILQLDGVVSGGAGDDCICEIQSNTTALSVDAARQGDAKRRH